MSDVLIKGMKMPDCCANCLFQILEREKYISFQYVIDASECEICDGFMTEHESYSKMLPKCPLVKVPPHGRLIDADALDIRKREQQAWQDYEHNPDNEYLEGVKDGLHEASKQLSTVMTIIEANSDVMFYPQVDGITLTVIKGEAEDQ